MCKIYFSFTEITVQKLILVTDLFVPDPCEGCIMQTLPNSYKHRSDFYLSHSVIRTRISINFMETMVKYLSLILDNYVFKFHVLTYTEVGTRKSRIATHLHNIEKALTKNYFPKNGMPKCWLLEVELFTGSVNIKRKHTIPRRNFSF